MKHDRKVQLRLWLNAELGRTGLFGFYDLYDYEQRQLLELADRELKAGKTIREIVVEWRRAGN